MSVKICSDEMLAFYSKFDYIDFKYDLDKTNSEYLKTYRKLAEKENNEHNSDITIKNYGKMLANIDLIYDDAELSERFTKIFDVFYNKVICDYLNIEGLERLFNEKYMDFEWNMHLGIDYKGHKRSYYRDHFIHQIRNAYMMHVMLDEFRFFSCVKFALQEGSRIADYVQKSIQQQMALHHSNDYEFLMHNIIYMASYIGALFHDIAYPECSNMKLQKRIMDFIPSLYNVEKSGLNWDKTYAVLQNSLLFKIVDYNKIYDRVMSEEPDHGALSAIVFLLNFYENGAIYHMEPYKVCALELGALSMYTHTDKYGTNIKCAAPRISFKTDPISYLLRICDDLQEWDRIYFEVISQSRCVICAKCKTPLLMKKKEDGRKEYICNCCSYDEKNDKIKNSTFMSLFQNKTDFSYRRVYNVTVCDWLKITEINPTNKNKKIIFELEYNLSKLLHIALLSDSYAAYRIKELNGIKELMKFQGELPGMYLKYNMTSNPVLIKVLMIERFFNQNNIDFINIQDIAESVWEKYSLSKTIKMQEETISNLKDILEQKVKEAYKDVERTIVEKVKKNVFFYLELYFWMLILKNLNQKGKDEKIINRFCMDLAKYYSKNYISKDLIEIIKDCFIQFSKMYVKIEEIDIMPNKYYNAFKSSAYTYGAIKRYIAPDNNWPLKMRVGSSKKEIDCYTDLYFFSYLEENFL